MNTSDNSSISTFASVNAVVDTAYTVEFFSVAYTIAEVSLLSTLLLSFTFSQVIPFIFTFSPLCSPKNSFNVTSLLNDKLILNVNLPSYIS